jgi:hypothetical protein
MSASATAAPDRSVTSEVRLAREFLSTLADQRASWAGAFARWASDRGLTEAEARAVKTTVLRLRMFGVLGRHVARKPA